MTEEFQKTNPLARGNKNIKPLEVYAEHAKIKKQVRAEIKKLHITLNARITLRSIDTAIEKFLDCLTPLKNLHDPGRLPVYVNVPRSKIPDKRSCVWAVVSCLVQAYWEYELGDETKEPLVRVYLERLKEINLNYQKMEIVGTQDKGYWLQL